MKLVKKILLGLLILLVVVCGAFIVWGETPAKAMPEAIAALQSDDQVRVDTGQYLTFSPADQEYTAGLILYPGGRVDYRAYAPMAHELAAQGYFVVIPRMPLNLAVFGVNKAEQVIHAYPQVENWVIGGHSLGGSMAAHYLYQNPDLFSGLVFLGSYPASSDDLNNFPGEVLSLSGSLDGLSTPVDIEASRALLPKSTLFVVIEGGNHAQFAWYGAQSGDNPATISREEQQTMIVDNIADLMVIIAAKE